MLTGKLRCLDFGHRIVIREQLFLPLPLDHLSKHLAKQNRSRNVSHGVDQSITDWSTLKPMPRNESPLQSEMLQGTLDLLILQTLVLGPAHGHTVAHAIERGSEEVLQIEHGSLYPALHRLEGRGWIASFWGTSENNRKAKYYRLTPDGRKQLTAQTARWEQVVRAIGRILKPAAE